jgi:hypothetical protein
MDRQPTLKVEMVEAHDLQRGELSTQSRHLLAYSRQ